MVLLKHKLLTRVVGTVFVLSVFLINDYIGHGFRFYGTVPSTIIKLLLIGLLINFAIKTAMQLVQSRNDLEEQVQQARQQATAAEDYYVKLLNQAPDPYVSLI
jgi:large-conductance mechanosensitive channel